MSKQFHLHSCGQNRHTLEDLITASLGCRLKSSLYDVGLKDLSLSSTLLYTERVWNAGGLAFAGWRRWLWNGSLVIVTLERLPCRRAFWISPKHHMTSCKCESDKSLCAHTITASLINKGLEGDHICVEQIINCVVLWHEQGWKILKQTGYSVFGTLKLCPASVSCTFRYSRNDVEKIEGQRERERKRERQRLKANISAAVFDAVEHPRSLVISHDKSGAISLIQPLEPSSHMNMSYKLCHLIWCCRCFPINTHLTVCYCTVYNSLLVSVHLFSSISSPDNSQVQQSW